MDECRIVGGVDFGETAHPIDTNLATLDLIITTRRLRDLLKMAEGRIGILTAVAEDSAKAVSALEVEVESLQPHTFLLQKAVADSLLIGTNSTPEEYREFARADRTTPYSRYGAVYEPIDDDWLTTNLTATSTLHEPSHARSDSGVSLEVQNRKAAIVPRPKVNGNTKRSIANIDFD
jgi:hypothetical protein